MKDERSPPVAALRLLAAEDVTSARTAAFFGAPRTPAELAAVQEELAAEALTLLRSIRE